MVYFHGTSTNSMWSIFMAVWHFPMTVCKIISSSWVFSTIAILTITATAAVAAAAASTVVMVAATEEEEASVWLIVVFHLAY